MNITDGERLIIAMLADIMKAQGGDYELDPNLISTLVCNKEDWALKLQYPGIFDGEPRDQQVVKETTDILWMWGIIEHSISKLTGIEAADAASWRYNKFHGFDGNNDDHYGVAKTFIRDLGRFSDFEDRNLNSHSQTSLPRYLEMYEKFHPYVQSGQANPLSYAALKEICDA